MPCLLFGEYVVSVHRGDGDGSDCAGEKHRRTQRQDGYHAGDLDVDRHIVVVGRHDGYHLVCRLEHIANAGQLIPFYLISFAHGVSLSGSYNRAKIRIFSYLSALTTKTHEGPEKFSPHIRSGRFVSFIVVFSKYFFYFCEVACKISQFRGFNG